ncbi:MAG: hypothetical protein F4138_02475 [Acidimicrobiia bacterium]|nr:hypothetical protein [Acidimicrobiia bacterium]MYC57227.1 hypothetical protein [Acidimicrobiia bacterium]MYG93847.1 hypothetical protein [Acidimicrobiia bacterium]MYI30677.1 hypothetical protein [Acidimicrobiia bacterium]
MSDSIMEVTVTGVLVHRADEREQVLSRDEYDAVFEKVSDSLHSLISDCGVSGQADTGELRIWFLVADADSFDNALKRMAAIISKVFRSADIVADPARKRTLLRLPRNEGTTVISGYKIVNEVLAA